jgi:hypothetical protein
MNILNTTSTSQYLYYEATSEWVFIIFFIVFLLLV